MPPPPPPILPASPRDLFSLAQLLFGRYADRCYASFDHGKQRERDSGALVLCCVSLFSAYPVIGRSDMAKLQGRGNYQNYDAHIVPVIPADNSNPRELNYFPCEAPSLSHPFPGACTRAIAVSTRKQIPLITIILRLHVHGARPVRERSSNAQPRRSSLFLPPPHQPLQVLPCSVVHLSRSRIPRPLLPQPGVPREIDLRYNRLLQGGAVQSSDSAHFLQQLLLLPQLAAFMEAGEAAAKQRRHAFKSDKLAARAASHIKSAALLSMGCEIGRGTFGTVYRAKWQGFDVAVKQLHKVDASASAALQKEAMIMMGVSSPNIVRVFGMVDQPLGIIMVIPTPPSPFYIV